MLLLRHGQTVHNTTGRLQGQLDTDLSDTGVRQAETVAGILADENIARIYSSDLTRARRTAEAVSARTGVAVHTDRRLRETDLGTWQDRTREDIDAAHPGMRAVWRNDPLWAPDGGETHMEVGRRGRAVIDEIMADDDNWDDHTVLVVAHGGLIMALTANLLRLAPEQIPMFNRLGNTCWAELEARPPFDVRAAVNGAECPAASTGRQPTAGIRFTPDTVDGAKWIVTAWNRTPH
nr:histidine phosphatase family protein [Corynebacterium mendelii]